ncbi:DUF6438 domain-containing protein [Stakelama marina]|uniref:DUF6438 domain-containing protein n=1 Tax=Stakelama marina TaxID=2826939 RepID=A0A8T4IHR8_9SPHN|nr:DUF6438 domain-containing protein [Stakelama marina]MBR0553424.1 hypothetical protein [Stakelama marina]
MRFLVLAMVALLGGCAVSMNSTVDQMELATIRYTTSPCFGACPVYSVTVGRDGHGVFDGKRYTAVSGKRDFDVSPAQFEAFKRALAPYRPTAGETVHKPGTNCDHVATDMPSVEVVWTQGNGRSQRLYHYFGCDLQKYAGLAQALRQAPDTLPIAAMIGHR